MSLYSPLVGNNAIAGNLGKQVSSDSFSANIDYVRPKFERYLSDGEAATFETICGVFWHGFLPQSVSQTAT